MEIKIVKIKNGQFEKFSEFFKILSESSVKVSFIGGYYCFLRNGVTGTCSVTKVRLTNGRVTSEELILKNAQMESCFSLLVNILQTSMWSAEISVLRTV